MNNHAAPRLGAGVSLLMLVVGGTVSAAGVAMLVAALGGLLGDGEDIAALAIPGVIVTGVGLALLRLASGAQRIGEALRPEIGFAAVTLAWVSAALVGAIPLIAAGTFSSPLDAGFEAMSGFTTTGATLINQIGEQPDAILLWRSLMQWLGGIGIVVLVVAIAPVSGPAIQRAYYAEVSGVAAERLTPRIVDTAKILAGIYITITALAGIAYLVAGMAPFDALNHTLTTVSTGGFSTKNDSIAAFDSLPIELVAISFMALAGVNFAFYWRAVRGKSLMPQLAEVRAYAFILLTAIVLVTASVVLADDAGNIADSLRGAAFSVTTVLTGTGYVTVDFDLWNSFARVGLLALMFVGACAGSTAGGIKVVRIILLGKAGVQELDRQIRPSAVHVLRLGGKSFSEEVRRAILGFFLLYVFVYAIGALALAATGLDPVTAISGASSTLNIVGPGLGEIGATDNFTAVPAGGRAISIVLMLTGRLEVFTVVALAAMLFGLRRAARA
jgi:trk system potassium uptake protein TrkH